MESIACSDIGSGISIGNGSFTSTTLKNICANGCGTDTHAVYNGTYANYCSPKNCGTGNLHSAGGNCQTCPTSGTLKTIGNTAQAECEACGNHIYLDGYCIYYNPGTSGVCNNDGVGKFSNYSAGVGVYYRDNTGICRRCDSQTLPIKQQQKNVPLAMVYAV
ncbi:MAG: hypothetical protein IKZ02_06185 [Alphaproteobacteria bacterium]|nr:hypothetical protein [Alphaproteobacteria bacterium]